MKLILTDYISSLKEDKELDALIVDILKAKGINIISGPDKGRQHGVDIYAVGSDFEDKNIEKVFLITVKQGDLDRRAWNTETNSVYQSLNEIKDVFLHNNLLDQHKKLPVKIVVAFNGLIKTAVQQDWKGYTKNNRKYKYVIWNEGWLLKQFEENLLNEHAFSKELRTLVRKTIIHLESPEYDLKDFSGLLAHFQQEFKLAAHKKAKLKLIRELHVIISIILKYCKEANNLLHAVRITERYILALGEALFPGHEDADFTRCFVAAHHTMLEILLAYFAKVSPYGAYTDGFSKGIHDATVYTEAVYRHVGIFALTGLVVFQLSDIVSEGEQPKAAQAKANLDNMVNLVATAIVVTINKNQIFYTPRSDDQHIEIGLVFILLYRLGMKKQISDMLSMFYEQISEGYDYLHIFPEYHNSKRTIAELQVNNKKRATFDYEASNLLTMLTEWCVIIDDQGNYQKFVEFKNNSLKELNLMLWFPEKETEELIYHQYATRESGYSLSGIELPESLADYRAIILEEYNNNCAEKEFSFMKQKIWSIGLMASRNYRTYLFPYYWRQFLNEAEPPH
jgi:hypothetical protein